ncbi:MAG: hypothetical protein NTZ74_15290 [Chloroflexi bacterium]|nr:hypothetical protein [Chloroflexota bacterium]
MNTTGRIIRFFKKDPDLGGRVLLVLCILIVMFIAILLGGPKPDEDSPQSNPIPVPTSFLFPSIVKAQKNYPDIAKTTGLIVGVTAIFLIIQIGVLVELGRDKKKNNSDPQN